MKHKAVLNNIHDIVEVKPSNCVEVDVQGCVVPVVFFALLVLEHVSLQLQTPQSFSAQQKGIQGISRAKMILARIPTVTHCTLTTANNL